MKTIGYQNLEDVLLNIADPNTGGTIGEVPGVSSPKINAGVSIYNEGGGGGGGGTGLAGWSTDITWTATDNDRVSWTSGYIYLPDGTDLAVSSGNTGNMSGMTYIYYDRDSSSVQTTTSAQTSVGDNKILLCVAAPVVSGKEAEFQAFGTNGQSTFITADNIAANTITGNEIAANTITASEIASGTITADKLNVTTLSAITANMGDVHVGVTTSGNSNESGIRLYPDSDGGKMQFYYNKSVVGTIKGMIISGSNNGIGIVGTPYVGLGGTIFCSGKLRIPVGTDLYT